jgi:hypothetical protein
MGKTKEKTHHDFEAHPFREDIQIARKVLPTTSVAPRRQLDPNELIRVRLRHGSLSLGYSHDAFGNVTGQVVANTGDIVQLPRGEVQALLDREFEGYPMQIGPHGEISVERFPGGTIRDCAIEIVDEEEP